MWNRFLHRLRLARSLAFHDWLSLFEAWWVLFVFYAALHWLSLERLLRRKGSVPKETHDTLTAARHLHRLVGWAARLHGFPMTCLVQSLSLHWMLRRRGIASSLKIGAAMERGLLHAHTWLEVDGEKVGESEDVNGIFHVLTRGTSP